MNWKRFRLGAGGALFAVAALVVGVVLVERHDANLSLQRQMAAVEADIELSADRLTRDLTQEVAVVQGLVALVSGHPDLDAAAFNNYTRNFRRGRENLRRVTNAVVTPAIVTVIAFAAAYTINAALSAFVWPEQPAGRIDSLQRAPSILRHFIAILLYTTAGLWVAGFAFDLDLHGIGLTSGAAGIIVGFATQKIILDFFSGVMLGIERPFEIGDWVELKADGADLRGVVYEMTWRTTMIRNSNYDMVTIPNSVISQATVTNRSRPNRWSEITIPFDVGAEVSAERIEQTVMDALKPLAGTVLIADRQPNLKASAIQEGDVKYRLNVYAQLGPNSERPVQDKIVRTLRDAFEAAGIQFSSTSATVLQILAGASRKSEAAE